MKMSDFYPSMGLVDENFINEPSAVLLRNSIKLSKAPRKGLLKEAWKAQNLGRGC